MFSITSIILSSTFLNFLILVQCAPELPTEDSYGIVVTERVIRNTVNQLFSTLKLKTPQETLKLERYSIIHNVFAAITLRDHDNLKKIETLTQVGKIDNGTTVFITQLNEVLKEDNKSDEATDSVYVKILMEEFLNKLYSLKEKFDVKNNTKLFNLHKAIMKHFSKIENEFGNNTNLKEKPVKGNHSNYNGLSNDDFWQPSGRRIFQGKAAKIKRFPFMASVLFFDKFQCAGSILKADLIITSASCLQLAWNNRYYRENPQFLSVQVGTNFYKQGGENIPISEIYFNPGFDPKTLRHNLALMRLSRVLKIGRYNQNVKMIDFDKHPSPLPSNIGGIDIIGWGSRNFGNRLEIPRRNKLTYSTLDFYPLNDCQEVYSKEFVTDRNFCAGFYSKGGGACNHDAGGPGVSMSSGILLGVISFGSPMCGTPDAPTVFTKLGYYTDWIEKIRDMEVITQGQHSTIKPLNIHTHAPTYRIPPKRLTPVVEQRIYQVPIEPTQEGDVLRMNDKKHNFGEFLKTIFKKKEKKQQGQQQQDQQQQPQKQEEIQQEEEDMQQEEEEIQQEEEKMQQEEEEKDVTDYQGTTQFVQEINKQSNNITEEETEKEDEPTGDPENKLENQDITTTLEPGTSFEVSQEKTTTLQDNQTYDASSTNSKENLPPLKHQSKKQKDISSSQEKELDEATDSLNLNYFLESPENSFEVSVHPRSPSREVPKRIKPKAVMTTNKVKKPRSEVGNKNQNAEDENNANYSSDSEDEDQYSDSGEDDGTEITEIAKRVESSSTVESQRAHKKEPSAENKNVDYESSYDSETDEDFELLSIPVETFQQENSSSISTERLMDMLEYEDVVKLLVEEVIR